MSDHNHQYLCQARWQEIQHIVEPRTAPAKTAVTRRQVATLMPINKVHS
jgi:hypothetical protein